MQYNLRKYITSDIGILIYEIWSAYTLLQHKPKQNRNKNSLYVIKTNCDKTNFQQLKVEFI